MEELELEIFVLKFELAMWRGSYFLFLFLLFPKTISVFARINEESIHGYHVASSERAS
jgi:hypothetical protein